MKYLGKYLFYARSVQKSRIIDWNSNIEKLNLHPVHSKVDLADHVTFEI